MLIGLYADGTVSCAGDYSWINQLSAELAGWTDIVSLACYENTVIGVKSDGSVVTTSNIPPTITSNWKLF